MADSIISGLPSLSPVPATAVFPADSGGVTYKATLADMLKSFQQASTTVYWGGSAGVSDVNAINLTIPLLSANGISSYFDGLTVGFYTTNGNTGTMTLNVNGIGAVTLRYGTSQISSGDVATGRLIFATYIAANTQWRIAPANGYQYILGAMSALSVLNGVLQGDSGASFATTQFVQSSLLAGTRNRLINGGMAVDQRNGGAAQTITTAGAVYTVDRWLATALGANVTGQRVAGSTTAGVQAQYRYQFTGAASVTGILFAERIEAANSYDLAGNTVTLGVDLANSLLTTVTWSLAYATATDNFTSTTAITSGTFTVTSTVTRYSVQVAVPAAAVTGLLLQFQVGAQTSGTWVIGNAQLEPGPNANVFERRNYQQELALCQRYLPAFNYSSAVSDYTLCMGQCLTTTQALVVLPLPVTPRIAPTGVTVSAPAHFALTQANNTGVSPTSIAFLGASVTSAELNCQGATGLVAGNATIFRYANAAGQLLFTGCEL